MPLDPLQDRIARTAGTLPEARMVALAGGGAMIAHGFVSRQAKDVDLFTEIDNQEAVRGHHWPASGAGTAGPADAGQRAPAFRSSVRRGTA